jgi:hypothetical protein
MLPCVRFSIALIASSWMLGRKNVFCSSATSTLSNGYTEVPSPGIEPGTSVSGPVSRNQVPRRKVGTHWGYISYVYPRIARATGSRSTSTIGEIVGPRLPLSTTYGCVHYHAHHGDLTTHVKRRRDVGLLFPVQPPAVQLSKKL